mmetsp:Transcript_51192/g.128439  ORF Transcript_51192/g.128439 Transcript_51192/m.128439 type:complete len:730 (+) Transcript_51192:80-2269(+)
MCAHLRKSLPNAAAFDHDEEMHADESSEENEELPAGVKLERARSGDWRKVDTGKGHKADGSSGRKGAAASGKQGANKNGKLNKGAPKFWEELRELQDQLDSGVITAADFKKKKAHLVDRMTGTRTHIPAQGDPHEHSSGRERDEEHFKTDGSSDDGASPPASAGLRTRHSLPRALELPDVQRMHASACAAGAFAEAVDPRRSHTPSDTDDSLYADLRFTRCPPALPAAPHAAPPRYNSRPEKTGFQHPFAREAELQVPAQAPFSRPRSCSAGVIGLDAIREIRKAADRPSGLKEHMEVDGQSEEEQPLLHRRPPTPPTNPTNRSPPGDGPHRVRKAPNVTKNRPGPAPKRAGAAADQQPARKRKGGYEKFQNHLTDPTYPDFSTIAPERALRFDFCPLRAEWTTKPILVKIAPRPFAKGGMRFAYHMEVGQAGTMSPAKPSSPSRSPISARASTPPDAEEYVPVHESLTTPENSIENKLRTPQGREGPRTPPPGSPPEALKYVAKVSIRSQKKSRTCCAVMSHKEFEQRDLYFQDVELQMYAKQWAKLFNSYDPPKKVDFIKAFVIEMIDRPNRPLFCVERYISGSYRKHNNNWGYVSKDERNTPQAFSHFTYHLSNHKLLICDIQGVGDLYTDPLMHSTTQDAFGRGNMSREGMERFLSSHECNAICKALCLPPVNPKPQDDGTVPNPRYRAKGSPAIKDPVGYFPAMFIKRPTTGLNDARECGCTIL